MEEKIIDPVPVELIEAELTEERLLRHTNKANNLLYVVNAHNAPNVMLEIGRLRELSFRSNGSGVGKSCDIDEFDTMEEPYQQLIVWNPDSKEIIGGYRFILGENVKFYDNGQPKLAISHLFTFSNRFIKEYLPNTIKLGRSFVAPGYQSSKGGAKSLFALDNLWDGLGALTVKKPQIRYFLGKMSMGPNEISNKEQRNMILNFLKDRYGDKEGLISVNSPVSVDPKYRIVAADFKEFNAELKKNGYRLPPLFNSYLGLSGTAIYFGTTVNDTFSTELEDSGLMVFLSDIFEEKRERHIDSYLKEINQR